MVNLGQLGGAASLGHGVAASACTDCTHMWAACICRGWQLIYMLHVLQPSTITRVQPCTQADHHEPLCLGVAVGSYAPGGASDLIYPMYARATYSYLPV